MPRVSEADLRRELSDLEERHPKLKPDELFVLWFILAFITDDEQRALEALCGGAGDKSVDAVVVDDETRVVFIVQGKYRKQLNAGTEPRNDVLEFARLGPLLVAPQLEFQAHSKTLAPSVHEHLMLARNRVRRGYRVQLCYLTGGRCSAGTFDDAKRAARAENVPVTLIVIDGNRVLRLLADYLDGVAPPVPSLDLELDGDIMRHYDRRTDIESWIFSMCDKAVAEMHERAGTRLFARNVRGFLGSTEINKNMESTLSREPEFFWYYNNGITIICDAAERIGSHGRDLIRVSNPQVINGQQTTRTLARAKSHKASVLVRVIRVPRANDGISHFDKLVSQIVSATNSQNAVKPSDLMANDRQQIEIERGLRKLGYGYIRKRQTKGDAKRALGVFRFIIKKEELAQAVAACDLDPYVVREGKERLFEKRLYPQVFPNGDPFYYLMRYWLMREVGYTAKGYPERAYAKWLVLNSVWPDVSNLVRTRAAREVFKKAWERSAPPMGELQQMNTAMFKAASEFFRKTRGKGDKAQDVSTFFKRRTLEREFRRFWNGSRNSHRARYHKALNGFEKQFRRVMSQ